jgi:prepilin-type N-terminal cleavage/methylation domain-containing protein
MFTARPRSSGRAAFTLLELLIVLAVLVMLLAVTWPAVGGLMAKHQLQAAAKQVRAAWAKTRLEAMESGGLRRFRYQPGTGHFQVGSLNEAADPRLPTGRATAEPNSSSSPADRWLPAGVRFERLDQAPGAPRPAALSDVSDENWSEPILFFPNGRTSNARLELHGRQDWAVPLLLRGVTGTVTVGRIQRATLEEGA